MPATKRTDLHAMNLRLPKSLHRTLKQEAKRLGTPLNTLIVSRLEGPDTRAAEQIKATVKQAVEETGRTLLADILSPENIARFYSNPENVERVRALRKQAGLDPDKPEPEAVPGKQVA